MDIWLGPDNRLGDNKLNVIFKQIQPRESVPGVIVYRKTASIYRKTANNLPVTISGIPFMSTGEYN